MLLLFFFWGFSLCSKLWRSFAFYCQHLQGHTLTYFRHNLENFHQRHFTSLQYSLSAADGIFFHFLSVDVFFSKWFYPWSWANRKFLKLSDSIPWVFVHSVSGKSQLIMECISAYFLFLSALHPFYRESIVETHGVFQICASSASSWFFHHFFCTFLHFYLPIPIFL